MNSKLNPYLNFDGDAREAIEFYRDALGGALTMMSYKEGGMSQDPSEDTKVMHAMLVTDSGMTLMASDIPKGWPYTPGMNVSVSLSGDDEIELKGYWERLSAGAEIGQPMAKASWGDTFGMLTDKFGIRWLVNIAGKKS